VTLREALDAAAVLAWVAANITAFLIELTRYLLSPDPSRV